MHTAKAKKIVVQTINLIEIPDKKAMQIEQLCAYQEGFEGNQRVESLFKEAIRKHYPEIVDDEIESACEDGYFDRDNYYICIAHSTNEN